MTGFSTAQFLPCDTLYCTSYIGQLLEENITKERFSSGKKKKISRRSDWVSTMLWLLSGIPLCIRTITPPPLCTNITEKSLNIYQIYSMRKLYRLKGNHWLTSSDCNIRVHVHTGRGSSDGLLYFWEGSVGGGDGCCRESEEADKSLHITTYHTIHINKETTLEIHLAEEIVLECWVWVVLYLCLIKTRNGQLDSKILGKCALRV